MNIDDLTDAQASKLLASVRHRENKRARARAYHLRHADKINRKRRVKYHEEKVRLEILEESDGEDVGSAEGQDQVQLGDR